jgi:hypothetical protein
MDSRITITSGGLAFPLQSAPIVRDMAGMSVLANGAGVEASQNIADIFSQIAQGLVPLIATGLSFL